MEARSAERLQQGGAAAEAPADCAVGMALGTVTGSIAQTLTAQLGLIGARPDKAGWYNPMAGKLLTPKLTVWATATFQQCCPLQWTLPIW